jgi:hypothetical protein
MKTNQISNKAQTLKRALLALTLLVASTCMVKAESTLFQSDGINKVYTDTSSLPIQDSIAAACPNLPDAVRFSSGRPFYGLGLEDKYDQNTMESIEHWAIDYPGEASEYAKLINNFIASTDLSSLSYTQTNIYHDLYAVWIVVHHEGN